MRSFLWNLYARFFERFTRLRPYQTLLDEVVGEVSPRDTMSILDAGCGPGALTYRLMKACPTVRVLAMDLSHAMLKRAHAQRTWPPTITFQQADLDLGLASTQQTFDRIACVNVLWALPDPGKTLARMAARLVPGGHLVLVTPRARFRADRIVWEHLRQSRGWDRVRAVAGLPILALGGLLNLLLVGTSLWSSRGHRDLDRFSQAGVGRLCEEAGLSVEDSRTCYADQAFLVRATAHGKADRHE